MTPSPPDAYLLLESDGRRFELAEAQAWAIGRGDGCAIMLNSRSVSRLHALIQRKDAGNFSLVDLGSRNGSFVNSRRVSLPLVLNDSDRLIFGDQELVFHQAIPTPVLVPPANSGDTGSGRNAPTTAIHIHSLTTIVVVDIRDYTPLARTVSEALLSQTIGTWFLRVGQVLQSRGSWAQKYIGDAVMAVWVHDHGSNLQADLLRAVHAVTEIDAATAEISRSLPLPAPLRIGAGVNTGTAIVGGADYTALGDTVNAAFRLEKVTKQLGKGVVLGERTFNELGWQDAPPFLRQDVELKGYDLLSTAWGVSFEDLREFLKKRP